jgi:general stress protein 26
MKLPRDVVNFLETQGFVIVSTLDKDGFVHNSCKGIVKISPNGKMYLLDLYRGLTYENLRRNSRISVTAVDEHKFRGYSLKGKAQIIPHEKLTAGMLKAWEDKISSRLTTRLLKNIHEEKGHPHHPEALLPKPEYMIMIKVEEMVDLTPRHIHF